MSSVPPVPEIGVTTPASSRHGERSRREHGERRHSPFLPLLLLVIAGVAWPAFQCYQLIGERQTLVTINSNQNRQFEDSGKLRASLDGIARDTAMLANRGNANAKLIVDELARRGVTINPSSAAGTPGAPDK